MKKLFFSLAATRKLGLTFSTHRSSMMSLQPGKSDILPLGEDEGLTNEELLGFYARYKPSGLTTKIFESPKENIVASDYLEGSKVTALPEKEDLTENSSTPAETPIEGGTNFDETEETLDEEILADVAEEDEDVLDLEDIDSWEFSKMREYVKENNIDVAGRSKDDHIKAIKEFLSKEG